MDIEISDVLVSEEEIKEMCQRLGKEISEDYAGEEVLFIGVLNGAFVFLADLIRNVDIPCQVEFLDVSSYGDSMVSSGNVQIVNDVDADIQGKHVIVVEDIIDTGNTLNALKPVLEARKPASLALCCAFDKYERREVDLKIDYCGTKIPNVFIVGYGLDYAGHYRNLRDLHYVEVNDDND